MEFLIRYELASSSRENEKKGVADTISLIRDFDWENELKAADKKGTVSNLDVIDVTNERILIVTAMEIKEEVLFTVESLRTGKKQKGKVGTLINDLPHQECLEVVKMFCQGDYASIDAMDNTGAFSKLLRKITFLFAGDDWHHEK